MNTAFYMSGAIAVLATFLAVTRREAIHGLVYLVVSLLAAAVAFLVLGAPFAAALEVITYAGAMMVMLLFAIMTLSPKARKGDDAKSTVHPWSWLGPLLLSALLMGDFIYVLFVEKGSPVSGSSVSPRQVGQVLFGPLCTGGGIGFHVASGGAGGGLPSGTKRFTGKGVERRRLWRRFP